MTKRSSFCDEYQRATHVKAYTINIDFFMSLNIQKTGNKWLPEGIWAVNHVIFEAGIFTGKEKHRYNHK